MICRCSDNNHSIHIYRGDVELTSGYIVKPEERLTVKIVPYLPHIVIEVRGATFESAKCQSTRTTNSNSVFVIPSSITENIIIACAWAKSYVGGVKVSTPLVLELRQMVEADIVQNVLIVV